MYHASRYYQPYHDAAVVAAAEAITAGRHHQAVQQPYAAAAAAHGGDRWTTPPGCADADCPVDVDCLSALLSREARDYSEPLPSRYYPREFEESTRPTSPSDIRGRGKRSGTTVGPWRRRIAGWMADVADHFEYDRDAVYIALRYADWYVAHLLLVRERSNDGRSSRTPVKRREFQLIAITSLYLAIKIHGVLREDLEKEDGGANEGTDEDEIEKSGGGRSHSRKRPSFRPRKRGMLSGSLRLSSFVELSRGLFTARDIVETESEILRTSAYMVNPPTPSTVSTEMSRVLEECMGAAKKDACRLPTTPRESGCPAVPDARSRARLVRAVRLSSRRQAEAAAGSPGLALGTLPSVVAYAAVLNAIQDEFGGHFQRHVMDMEEREDETRRVEAMEMERTDVVFDATMMDQGGNEGEEYDLQDFQRHYRRFSRGQNAPSQPQEPDRLRQRQHLDRRNTGNANANASAETKTATAWDVQEQLEAWREDFCGAVYRASDGALSPNDPEVREAREELRVRTGTGEGGPLDAHEPRVASPSPSGPADGRDAPSDATPPRKKTRSPRSPDSVIDARYHRDAHYHHRDTHYRRQTSDPSVGSDPYSFRYPQENPSADVEPAMATVKPVAAGNPHRFAHPHHEVPNADAMLARRASTPDFASSRPPRTGYATTEEANGDGAAETSSARNKRWRSEAFNPPPFFSA